MGSYFCVICSKCQSVDCIFTYFVSCKQALLLSLAVVKFEACAYVHVGIKTSLLCVVVYCMLFLRLRLKLVLSLIVHHSGVTWITM